MAYIVVEKDEITVEKVVAAKVLDSRVCDVEEWMK